MKKVIALNDHIIVELLQEIEEISEGGIVIPQTVVSKPQGYGKVVSLGSQVSAPVVIGDTVIFHRNAGMDIMIGKTILKVLKQPEVYAKLFDEKELMT